MYIYIFIYLYKQIEGPTLSVSLLLQDLLYISEEVCTFREKRLHYDDAAWAAIVSS